MRHLFVIASQNHYSSLPPQDRQDSKGSMQTLYLCNNGGRSNTQQKFLEKEVKSRSYRSPATSALLILRIGQIGRHTKHWNSNLRDLFRVRSYVGVTSSLGYGWLVCRYLPGLSRYCWWEGICASRYDPYVSMWRLHSREGGTMRIK
jgi:hypothetical protein